jgi:hypothetical protein
MSPNDISVSDIESTNSVAKLGDLGNDTDLVLILPEGLTNHHSEAGWLFQMTSPVLRMPGARCVAELTV